MLHPRALTTLLWVTFLYALPWPIYSHGMTLQPLLFILSHDTTTLFTSFGIMSQTILAAILSLALAISLTKLVKKLPPPLPISAIGLLIFSLLFTARTVPIYSIEDNSFYNLQTLYEHHSG